MPGGQEETYFLNFQAALLLEITRFDLDLLHRISDDPVKHSVVWRFLHEQMNVEPRSADDLVWRVLLWPLAIAAAALYVARENIFRYFHGTIKGEEALQLTPKAAVLFQAKLVSSEAVIEAWLASPFSEVEYPLLCHRLLAIMADVVGPGDDFIGFDIVGPAWTVNTTDHLAYGQSKTTRDHKNKRNKEPLVTKAPTILEATYRKGLRSKKDILKLLKETSIEKPLSASNTSAAGTASS
ncbi:hypothetical protein FA13DRAFT_1803782 [Coprinellus micaceus]|uniref:Uncharacterized protein n=1 Tax=Coprinellus micaceus TaxID=71717 RepID=A0A4Y7SAC3_COPMI|nr:hypothetical protein FA13DRAFT_1803782 [Coprinellus micaceus]